MAIERVPLRENPKLFDVAIGAIQQGLADRLGWLDYSFGRAERLVKDVDGRKYYTPNVYVGKRDYELVMPDDFHLGNYSFFVMDEPQDVEAPLQEQVKITAPFSLIVWVDMRTIDDNDERNTEAVKEAVLMALHDIHLRRGRFSVTKIYERAENVWQGFTQDETQNQFMMSPFAAFRFVGEMTIYNECIL